MGLPVFDSNMSDEDMDKIASNAMEASNFLKAISHEGRLMILCHLASGENRLPNSKIFCLPDKPQFRSNCHVFALKDWSNHGGMERQFIIV